ncbi:MAG: MerR family transcriptional regulator [Rickettsiales bacterium]|nr:MerR family transcriptional regulator [Rickettsiales bacterium]|tara:strand:- start:2978 stop:3289 length:312 start_codon:yes stop_codon:yes gene_type:complete
MKDLDALRTIGEVSQIINVPVYVIRFWEKKFDSIKPIKRKGGNRYFDKKQISNLIIIKKLLHEDKYSIQGAKKVLMKNIFVEKEKQTLIKEIKQLINKLKDLY